MKLRLVLPVLLAALAALFVAGCGGGDSGSGGGTDPASLAPPKTPLYIGFTVQPEGEIKANIEDLTKTIAGIDNPGDLIVEELESSAADEGEEIDFEKEIEPWLGERAGLVYPDFDEGEFEGFWAAIQVTDTGAAEDFVEEHARSEDGPAEKDSYEGVDFWVEKDDGDTFGIVDELVVLADSETLFKEAIDTTNGETLADESVYTDAIEGVSSDSAADVYVDIGTLLDEAEAAGELDQEAKQLFETAGVELNKATAVASLVPGSDQIEIDLSTNLGGDNPPSGDAAELLESLPATSVAAFASPEFGKRFNESIDQIDKQGIPGEVPPNQLKKTLKQAGIDLEAIATSIGDVGGYVTGNSEKTLGGALILEAEGETQATNTVSNIGLFLRKTGTPGITRITEGASGFSIRSPELGRQPVVVVAKGSRIAIGYGLAPTLASFQESGKTLADSAPYKEAVAGLGSTPITMFVDGPMALRLVEALVPAGEEAEEFEEAEPYLQKIGYLAIGGEDADGLSKAKLIIGVK